MLSVTKQNPSQSGVLQWNEFWAEVWASFRDFAVCLSNTAVDTSWKEEIHF